MKIKEFKKSQQKVHSEEVEKVVKETYGSNDIKSRLFIYDRLKKMNKLSWLIVLLTSLSMIMFSIGFGFLVKSNINEINIRKMGWNCSGIFLILFSIVTFITFFILGFLRAKNAAIYFNDKRRRYQMTLTDSEAKIRKARKILFLILLILIIVSIIVYCI